ncbi:MAG: hypothetical protein KKA81_04360 [Bacteroidetes bacterium]|nr:hypothetical protein [Bacteroidota bacterium]
MAGFKRQLTYVFFILLSAAVLLSCRKFEGDQTIPAYISLDSMSLQTDYSFEGSNSQKITTIWIYVDDNIQGIYELPFSVPVLTEGTHKLTIEAGIFLNGIKALRVPYPFYKPIYQDVDFVPGQVINLNDGNYQYSTTYESTCDFVWIEDFEDPSISLDSLSPSHVDIHRTYPGGDPEAYLDDHSLYSGVITLSGDKNYFRVATNVGNDEGFVLPRGNNPVFLEINFKSNAVFTVGVFVKGISTVETSEVLNFNTSSEWNKVYVNLKPVVNASVNAIDFNIFFEGYGGYGLEPTKIYLDNIKLIHYKVN